MKESGFYKLSDEYIDLVQKLNGIYNDRKERPIYCCIQDKNNPDIYWAIPTSDLSHRSHKQISRVQFFCSLPARDIRSCYYHIGHTNRPALFKVSNVLPITANYVSGEYISNGKHLILKDRVLISELSKKVIRILQAEEHSPNKFEQHITDIYNYLSEELSEKMNRDNNNNKIRKI